MNGAGTDRPHPRADRVAWAQLRLTKVTLLVILVGLSLVGRRVTAWPITTWPMYSTRTTTVPSLRVSALELRVSVPPGEVRTLTRMDFFPMGSTSVAERVMQSAFRETNPRLRDAHRTYLVIAVRRILRTDAVDTIEGWELEWAVDPLALPPLDRTRPVREVRLGGFSAAAYGGTTRDRP